MYGDIYPDPQLEKIINFIKYIAVSIYFCIIK